MNQTNDLAQNNQQSKVPTQGVVNTQVQPVSSGISKERETADAVVTEVMQPVTTEIELPKEVEKAGVTAVKEAVEIPPDVQKLGVKPAGPTTPVASTPVLPQVTLPISDQQVIAGLHAQITSAFLWLAVWCVKKLKKAHLALKNFHGKILRVKI